MNSSQRKPSRDPTKVEKFIPRSGRYRMIQAALWTLEKFSPACRLDAEEIERQALKIAGRESFLGNSHKARLHCLVESLKAEAGLNALGRVSTAQSIIGMLVNRLCLEEICGVANPSDADLLRPAKPPVFIVGLPRTGTTLLQKLMTSDPAARSLPLWEAAFPFMVANRRSDRKTIPARQAETARLVQATNTVAPRLAAIHELDPMGAEECYWLLMNTLADYIFLVRWRVPSFHDLLDAMGEDEWVGVYREYLATLRILDGGMTDRHWVLKYPFHARRIATIAGLVPNAIFVQTYRDITEVVGSFSSLLTESRGICSDLSDPAGDAKDCLQLFSKFSREAEDVAGLLADRVVHVHYKALTADPLGALRGIYDRAGLDWTPEGEESMRRALANNRKDRHGRHEYSLEDFGLEEQQVRSACASYEARERSLAPKLTK